MAILVICKFFRIAAQIRMLDPQCSAKFIASHKAGRTAFRAVYIFDLQKAVIRIIYIVNGPGGTVPMVQIGPLLSKRKVYRFGLGLCGFR